MDWIKRVVDFALHFDQHLQAFVAAYQGWAYLLLFAIIFCETGLVVTPFLPGDSLLFAAGAIAAGGSLNIWILTAILIVAAVLGDTVNYWIGAYIGPRAFSGKFRFLRKDHLDRTHAFFERHGGKTIILARFVPIIRTFAPFVAGVGSMHYGKFLAYNVVGGVAWVTLFTWAGYFFGQQPWVKKNFHVVIVAIIVISVLPMAYEYARAKIAARKTRAEASKPEPTDTAKQLPADNPPPQPEPTES